MTAHAFWRLSLPALAALALAASATAEPQTKPTASPITPTQSPGAPVEGEEDFFKEFELPEETRDAIEGFSAMIAPMLDRLGAMFEDLPQYEAPEILPNGDIIIRRKRAEDEYPPYPPIDGPGDQTKT